MARQYPIYHASTPVDREVVPVTRPQPEANTGSRSGAPAALAEAVGKMKTCQSRVTGLIVV